ncbi:hypothetical protein [Dongia rigui]|uniref:Uncharacterized protein n=1 Tax=Dongia rigui TaxID=940149 RepID=A0ABU5DXV2_9PROT|nr:hypothetical protein [Dongia rigui]MDY0872094.1 hypothetical protein [Dongia rigui]
MTRSQINLETMVRIDQTAGLVRNTVQQSFKRLQYCVLADPPPGMGGDRGLPPSRQIELLNASAEAIIRLSKQLLSNLFCMCELISRHSDSTLDVQARFAHILRRRPAVDNHDVIDLQMRRLLRLPINQALEIVLGDLEAACAEINERVHSVSDFGIFDIAEVS